jgi:hypothetical protein
LGSIESSIPNYQAWVPRYLQDTGLKNNRNGVEIGDTVPLDVQCSPVLHEYTKHIELDCHFVGEKIQSKLIFPCHIGSFEQITNFFTKPLGNFHFILFLAS